MAEWLKATDCKSVLSEYAGSNPALSTIGRFSKSLSTVTVANGAKNKAKANFAGVA